MTDINTVTTPSGCLLLIDSRVTDYQDIVNAMQSGVQHLVFNVEDTRNVQNPFEYIQTKIAELGVSAYTSVGLVQHNMRMPAYSMFGQGAYDTTTQAPAAPDATIACVETNDPTLQTWSGVSGFISGLKTTFGIQNFDMMACALYSDANWKYVIDTLTVQTGVTIRASTDDTGAAGLGGDWFLESHTGVNLKGVYFTEAIENYRGVLFWWGSDNFYTSSKRRPIKSYAVGGLQLWGDLEYGGQNNTGVGLTSDIVGICSDQYRYAALKTNGSVVAWGRPGSDADYTASATVVAVPTASLTTGVIDIVKNDIASAAIKSDGSVVIWGRVGAGAENNTGVNLSGVVNVYSGYDSFAALKNNGSVVCWGNTSYGGSTTTPLNVASSLTSGIVSVYSNSGSFAAINISGGVITWGYSTYANTSDVSNNLTSGVVAIYANSYAYAALKNNGSLVTWGDIRYGGATPGLSVSSDVIHVYPNSNPGFSALKTNGNIVGWGQGVSVPSLTNVVTICSNFYGACAALKSDGSVVVWGDAAHGGSLTSPVNVASDLSSGVIALYSSHHSFAALKSNGSVVTWGNTSYGGNSSTVASSLISGVVSITSTGNAFAALKSNGSVITWGSSSWGGSNNTSASISSGVVDIFNTGYSFAALKPTSTPSYDLSGSYYLDIDRLNILRSRDYRRTANLVTLNSNVHTLSATRSLQIFNYTMPTAKPLTMIVPDYQTAPYSLTSTITLPTSIVGSNSMLITSEIGERVNISGVGTYVNYGTYVYKVESNGTYTKTTSLTVNGTSYDLYGGDGVYSSGIALYNPTSTTTTLSNFSVSTKTYGTDTSFNLTDPSSNSPAGFTFSSSNTQVATISGRTVTVVGPGVSVITASQGGSGNFINADISASLVVGFGNVSSITRNISDGAFVIPAPLSNVLTTYGTTWNKLGADILGTQLNENSGYSVSISADGTVVAIGSLYYDVTGTNNQGRTRIYKYNTGTSSWAQLGSDISSTQVSENSGFSVSLSADGTVVAIGSRYYDKAGGPTNAGDDEGRVRVYKYNNVTLSWGQLGSEILGTQTYEQSGWSVSLSADGTTVAIGSLYYDITGTNDVGRTRIYKYNTGTTSWGLLGSEILGTQSSETSGHSVSLSADGTTVAIGSIYYDKNGGAADTSTSEGRTRIYKYNNGTLSWGLLGSEILGTQVSENSGTSVSLSADGTIVAIGSCTYDSGTDQNQGRTRIYKYNTGTSSWGLLGSDILGTQDAEQSGWHVSLSADGTTLAIGSQFYDITGTNAEGRVRVYKIDSSGNYTYTIGNSAIADICGNIVLPKIIGGSTTITVTQSASGVNTSKTASIPLLLLPITPTFQTYTIASKNFGAAPFDLTDPSSNSPGAFTFTSSNASVATISGRTVTIVGVGSATITATQAASGDYATGSVTASFTVNLLTTVLGALTVPAKTYGTDTTFNLADPTSNNTGGAFTYSSGNTQVATISGRTVTIIGPGASVITASQAAGNYTAASTTASLVVAFGNLSSVSGTIGNPFVIPTPISNVATTYGSIWNQLGADIDGEAHYSNQSGWSVSTSADGTVVAIGANYNRGISGTDFATGHVRVYKYTPGKAAVTVETDLSFGPVGWTRLGADIDGDAAQDQSGYSVSMSADGTVVAIGAPWSAGASGRVRVYKYTPGKGAVTTQSDASFGPIGWTRLGADIDGEAYPSTSGRSVSLSADGTVVAIGGAGNNEVGYDAGHVRVYKYTPGKAAVTNQNDLSFGPIGWTRLGADIDGEAVGDTSGWSVSLSVDGTVVAIGARTTTSANYTGQVRVYKYNPNKTVDVSNQSLANFGPAGWDRLGADIDGEAVDNQAGYSVSLSADGTIVAIGAPYNGGNSGTAYATGHVRVYKYNPNKTVDVSNQSLANFGPVGWDRLGVDIDGETVGDQCGYSVSLSADGTIVAIGAQWSDGIANGAGHVRIYRYTPNTWIQVGSNINGEAALDESGYSVSLSANGTTVAIGALRNDGAANDAGHVRVYRIDTFGNYTYTSSNPAIADICGNIVLPKSIGSTTINVTQSASGANPSKTATAQLTLSYAPTYQTYTIASKTIVDAPFNLADPSSNSPGAFTFTSSNASVATISGRTVTITGAGSTTITATQAASGDYAAASIIVSFTVSPLMTVLGALTVLAKTYGDASFNLTDPTSNNTGGIFTFSSSNTQVATISGRTVTILGPGASVITASQAAAGNYGAASTTASLVVAFGNLSSISNKVITDGPFVIPTPLSNVLTTYGTTWNKLGANIYGEAADDRCGFSVSMSADGTIVAIAAVLNDGTSGNVDTGDNRGHVRVYKYTPGKAAVTVQTDLSFGPIGWTRLGADIDGEAAGEQFGAAVSISADGTVVAISTFFKNSSAGRVRVFAWNGSAWIKRGGNIDGEVSGDKSGQSVSISADGNVVAIGAHLNDGSGNLLSDSGHVRVYKYDVNKTVDVSNQSLSTFGPIGWTRLGADIDGEAAGDVSGYSVSLSADGTVVAIGAQYNDGSGNSVSDNRGHVRVYKYNPNKTVAQLSNQSLSTFGPAGWDRLGADIDGEAAGDESGVSVSLSADGTTVAIGAHLNDGSGNLLTSSGHVRVYKYNPNKTVDVSNQSLSTFGPAGWDRLGGDIDGEAYPDYSGESVSLSADGTIVAIGAQNKEPAGGRVRIFKYRAAKTQPQLSTPGATDFGPAGWDRLGANIDGEAGADGNGWSVSLSTDGTTVAIGARSNDGPSGTQSAIGLVRVYRIDTSGNYTYTSNNTAIADICGNIVLPKSIGSTTITVTQSASGVNTSKSATVPFTLSKITPTIGTLTVPAKNFRDGSFNLTAPTSNSGGAFTYSSSNTSVATVTSDSGVVTIVGAGSATITATQASTTNYTAGSVTASLVVSPIAPTFGTFTAVAKNFRDASFSLTAPTTDSSGAFTYSSNTPSVATVTSGGIVTIVGVGSATITATQDACGNFTTRDVNASLVVSPIAPTFGTFTVPGKLFRDISFSLTAPTTDSSGVFTYSIDASGAGVATVTSDGVVTVVGAGSATITATQDACGNFTTRAVTVVLVVSPIAPTIGALTVPAKNFGDASFNLTAPTTDSSGAFIYTSSDPTVATVTSSGGTITILKVGNTTITATQDACGNFISGSVGASFVVSASLSNFTVPAKNYTDAAFDLSDPTSTDTTVGFTFASSNTAVATIGGAGGRTVSIVGVGSSVITATQAATANRGELNITATLVVSPIRPVITLAPITKAYGNSSFRLAPSSTNTDTIGGNVFTFSSSNIAVVSMLDASLVRINGVGTSTVAITQAASANFTDSSGSVVITVNKGASGFSASTFAVTANKTYGDASFAITTVPTSYSTGALTYTSSDEAVATIDNSGVITLVGFGTVNFTATQAASVLYDIDTKVSNNLSVARKTVALTRDTPSGSTITKTYGDANFTVSATNESNGAFSYESSDASFATVDASSGLVHIVAVGTTTITATRAQTAQYVATSVSWTLQINRGTTTLTGLSSLTRNVTVAPFTVTASSASNGAVTYALQDLSSTVLTIHPTSGLVTLKSPGSAVIVASQAQGTLYEAPASITATITVTAAANTLQGSTLTNSSSFANVDLSGASFTNSNITNTNFSSASLGNTNFSNSDISGATMTSADLSGSSLTSTHITNTNFNSARLNNANFNNSTISGATMTGADLSGASLTTTNITNTNFSSANLRNTNFNNSTISGATMTGADLSGSTMRSATITGTNFTSAILQRTDLSGANVRSSIFNSADLSGSTLTHLDASGASFINANLKGANLSNAVFTNANMTNANISGANISNVTFTVPQKLQLLKSTDNRTITDIQVSQVLGSTLLPILSAGSAVRDLPNVATATFKVMLPTSSLVANETLIDVILDITNFAYFYFPIGENEYFQIEGVKYYISGNTIRNHTTNAVVENSTYGVKAIRLIAGSLTVIVNSQNTLPTSSFVVPSTKINTDAPFGVITAPTSNSLAPIVYASTNTSIATIHPSTGIITLMGESGFVRFTASQVLTETHESASITSNEMFVNRLIDLTLPGLNQTFSLSTLASLDASSIAVETTDATAVFYVRLSDMTDLFQYQTDSFDINDISSSDLKYYVFHRNLPAALKLNPSHAMMNKTESAGMLGMGQGIMSDKSLVKHDFVRYIALRLFYTIHGVDLFSNETDLLENVTYLGETVRNNIDLILSGISTTSSSETMSYDASGNKYLTNDVSGNMNLCRELMRQIAASDPSRLYNNGANNAGLKNVPLRENDSILFKLTITSAASQNMLTGVSVLPSRTYTIKLVLKNTVNSVTNANTVVTDSEMYPISYAYSTSVVTYAPTSESSGVYNVYSPPAPIPFSRFGYNGWYYTNSTAWVNVAQSVRDRVKWIVPANTVGSSTVGELRYIRINMKVFNKTSLPYLVVYTQDGSYRKYTFATPNSLVNGTVYSFYMNFNSYSREPAMIGSTNAALTYSGVSSGSFANNEVVTSIAVESDSGAATGSVEFTLASVVVGEFVSATSLATEKEYGFSAEVPVSYP